MLIAVIGGKLQGVEVVYLAHKAGYNTLLIDKDSNAPAVGLSNHFLKFEFNSENPFPLCRFQIDLIIPAIEDDKILTFIERWAAIKKIPLAFDSGAYNVSKSKNKSNSLFEKLNLPVPKSWPGCTFPVVVKPEQASGSSGVKIMMNQRELFDWLTVNEEKDTVIQEYVEGLSFSIEVIGFPGNYQTPQVTDLYMDKKWDCKRIEAPSHLPAEHRCRFKEMGIQIAEALKLKGIMDLEMILSKNELKLLEIDARFPSQTPIAVFWSKGINMVEMLVCLILKNRMLIEPLSEKPVVVEHIKISGGTLCFSGEHIMAEDGSLKVESDFFGADEAITSFAEGKDRWVATLIFKCESHSEIELKRNACYEKINEYSKLFVEALL